MAGSKLQGAIDIFFWCHGGGLSWFTVRLQWTDYSCLWTKCVIWKSVNEVIAHVMDKEVKDFLNGIVTRRSGMQRYCNHTLPYINS